MSLSALSTELDTKIAEFLADDRPTTSAFSQVSKYYRAVSEPLLYKHLLLDEYDGYTTMRLLFTILSRDQLALHIQSLTVLRSTPPRVLSETETRNATERNQAELWECATKIQATINGIASPDRGFQNHLRRRMAWFGGIYTFQTKTLDHILAVILCMAPNVHILALDQGHDLGAYQMTRSILTEHWKGVAAPFAKLEALTLSGARHQRIDPPLLPSMTSLEVKYTSLDDSEHGNLLCQPLPMPAQPLLRRLVLVNILNFSPGMLMHLGISMSSYIPWRNARPIWKR
jgi:hypothetical protein